jgi:hypothetical protein
VAEILKQPNVKFLSTPVEIPKPQRSQVINACYSGVSKYKIYKNFEPRDYPLRRHYDQPNNGSGQLETDKIPNSSQAQTSNNQNPITGTPTGYL